MVNGKFRGGPMDGQVIESPSDFLEAFPETPPGPLGVGYEMIINDVVALIVYEKIHHWNEHGKWYEWELQSELNKVNGG